MDPISYCLFHTYASPCFVSVPQQCDSIGHIMGQPSACILGNEQQFHCSVNCNNSADCFGRECVSGYCDMLQFPPNTTTDQLPFDRCLENVINSEVRQSFVELLRTLDGGDDIFHPGTTLPRFGAYLFNLSASEIQNILTCSHPDGCDTDKCSASGIDATSCPSQPLCSLCNADYCFPLKNETVMCTITNQTICRVIGNLRPFRDSNGAKCLFEADPIYCNVYLLLFFLTLEYYIL